MKIDLSPNEKLIHEGAANLQRGIEGVGGKLSLTDLRLVFSSHALNVQTGITEIPLRDIRSVRSCWTRLFGLIPVVPNGLAVQTNEAEHRFVLFGRSKWLQVIMSEISKLSA